jgi:hypothetical protein
MRRNASWRVRGVLILGVVLGGVALMGALRSSQTASPVAQSAQGASRDAATAQSGPSVAHFAAASKPMNLKPHELFLRRARSAVFNVRKLKSVVVKQERPENEDPSGPPGSENEDSDKVDKDAGDSDQADADMPSKLAQKQMVQNSVNPSTSTPSSDTSFDGLDFANWGAGHPPDENGDVGPNYYIQTVNTSIGIYDKSNGNRVAAFTFNAFMSQGHFGNLCDTNNFGDPVVLYDTYEDRWMITDFAFQLNAGAVVNPPGAFECFAVSKTGDPVNGGWNFYSIAAPGALNDYPKFGVWPDGIYMSSNMFGYPAGSSYQGYHAWALNKAQMYAGAPSVSVVDFAGTPGDFTVIPANSKLAAGTPPAGSPEYFVSTWNFLNAEQIYKFHVDWDKISTSTFTGPFNQNAPNCWPNAAVANAATGGNAADVLQIRAMAAPQYTNQGGVESVWVAHTVQRGVSNSACSPLAPTGGFATVRWYQLDVTGSTVAASVAQGSSFDPEGSNTFYRFQPSVAVDHAGDMAMTYTKSNSSTFPSIMFNGRLAGDPLNTLGSESTLIAGTGAQTGTCGGSTCIRWGDYSGMELDPDGCEFWMTGEYFATSGLNDLTRIGSFHYPGCTPVGNGTLSGTVTDGSSPISGATVTLGSRTTTTDGSGNYSFSVPAGTYPTLTADSPGYTEGSASSLVVPDGGTLTHDFTLGAAAQSGCITDDSQSLFQRGVASAKCDLTSTPGSVTLSNAPVVDQQNTAGTSTGTGFGTPNWTGQTFTEGITGQVTKVDFTVFCNGCTSNPNIAVSIRATSGGVPTGADLASTTIAGDNSGSTATLTATFSSPPTLTAGTQYALIVHPVSAPGGSGYFWIRASPSSYAGGSRVLSSDSGSSWTADSTRDYNFHEYVSAGYAPSATLVSSLRDANPAAGAIAQWTTLSWSATTPANTAVKFQVAGSNSPYGPFTFVGPDGTASTYFTTSGADLSQFNGDRYLKYEAFLSSSDSAVTPALTSVSTCFQNAAPTTLTASDASGTYGGTTTLTATLTAGGSGVPGKSVEFTLNGSDVGGATTDASGVAELDNVSLSGIDAGSYPAYVGASFDGDTDYQTSSDSSSLTVSKADQAIVITTHAPSDASFGDQFTVAATGGGSGNAVTYSSSGACSNIGDTFTITGPSACNVMYDEAGNTNYNDAPELTETVNGHKADQTISITTHAPSTAVYGTDFTVSATGGGSGNAVVYGSSGGCTNTGAHFTMTSGSTDCTVTYDQDGDSNHDAAPQKTETVTAQKADQTIDVTMAAPSTAVYNSSFDVDANAAGGAVSFSSTGVCSNAGATFTMTSGTGTCTVHFNRAGDDNYNAAPEVTEGVTATKADQSIDVTTHAPASAVYNTSFTVAATAPGAAVAFASSGACGNVGATFKMTSGTGTCTVTYRQSGDANYNAAPDVVETTTAVKAAQTIVVTTHAPSTAPYGASFTVAAKASTVPVTYTASGSCTNSGATFTMTSSTDTCTVTYHQSGNANYNPAPKVVEKTTAVRASQTITVTMHAPSFAAYHTSFTVAATASSGLAVKYAASGSCTHIGATFTITRRTGECTVTYRQPGNANYRPADKVFEFTEATH